MTNEQMVALLAVLLTQHGAPDPTRQASDVLLHAMRTWRAAMATEAKRHDPA